MRGAGASTVKWTTLDPCLGSRESDSKQRTNFEFCEENFYKLLKTYRFTDPSIYDDKKIPIKVYIFWLTIQVVCK